MSGIIGQRGIGKSTGIVGPTAPAQPAFLCVGDSSTAFSISDSTASITGFVEVFDQGNDVTTSGRISTFTAPVTGRYLLTFSGQLSAYTSGDEILIWIKTSNRNYYVITDTADVKASAQPTVVADMDASDTAYLRAINSNGARGTISASDTWLYFSGCLLA